MQACKASIWGLEVKLLLYIHVTTTASQQRVFYTCIPAPIAISFSCLLGVYVCIPAFSCCLFSILFTLSLSLSFSSWVRDGCRSGCIVVWSRGCICLFIEWVDCGCRAWGGKELARWREREAMATRLKHSTRQVFTWLGPGSDYVTAPFVFVYFRFLFWNIYHVRTPSSQYNISTVDGMRVKLIGE